MLSFLRELGEQKIKLRRVGTAEVKRGLGEALPKGSVASIWSTAGAEPHHVITVVYGMRPTEHTQSKKGNRAYAQVQIWASTQDHEYPKQIDHYWVWDSDGNHWRTMGEPRKTGDPWPSNYYEKDRFLRKTASLNPKEVAAFKAFLCSIARKGAFEKGDDEKTEPFENLAIENLVHLFSG